MAPDPGRTRLRFATRAVLGIVVAVAECGLAGHCLTGAVTGGLAALLALFTVTDATVRGQAVTTALLPVVGLPVLTAVAGLHDHPVARDLAQFLHAISEQLPELYAAVLLSVLAAAAGSSMLSGSFGAERRYWG